MFGEIIRRIVEVDVVIVVAIQKTPNIKGAAHADARRNQVRMSHGKV
jgi:hypothetical protein